MESTQLETQNPLESENGQKIVTKVIDLLNKRGLLTKYQASQEERLRRYITRTGTFQEWYQMMQDQGHVQSFKVLIDAIDECLVENAHTKAMKERGQRANFLILIQFRIRQALNKWKESNDK